MIEFKNISKSYFTSKKIEVLKNINFIFEAGKIYSLIGPSGSGKSTLLNLISLIDKPSNGFIKLNKIKIDDNDIDQRDNIRSKMIGIIYQDKNLLSDFTTLENVYMARLSLDDNKKKAFLWSKFPVGSSAKIISGEFINALDIAIRCDSPPDNSLGK